MKKNNLSEIKSYNEVYKTGTILLIKSGEYAGLKVEVIEDLMSFRGYMNVILLNTKEFVMIPLEEDCEILSVLMEY